ncbi:MAG: GT4 family glycosyltransferase PelF, partial [Firmicutes bacterium]|nr:GT4 family glycosyltransferase PelF [Candidatus Scybalomonas excrementavium]
TLISSYMLAKQQEPKLKLWIMGNMDEDPEYAKECKNMVENLKIQDVIFTGTINVMEYIGKMDIMVLSSISEGQPLSILEGFAAQKPFITTNVGNCHGLIYGEHDSYGSAGYVVPVMGVSRMAECMVRLAQSSEERKRMGEIAYQRVIEHYDDFDIYQRYYHLYQEMIG